MSLYKLGALDRAVVAEEGLRQARQENVLLKKQNAEEMAVLKKQNSALVQPTIFPFFVVGYPLSSPYPTVVKVIPAM